MHKYGMRLRPLGLGCQPSRWCKYDDSNKEESGYYSFVWYERKLTDEEVKRFELDYLGEEKWAEKQEHTEYIFKTIMDITENWNIQVTSGTTARRTDKTMKME